MNGDRALWQMRRAQSWPESVWLVDGEALTAHDWHQQRNCLTGTYYAEIEIAAGDVPEALDLRCCVGLQCHVTALRGESRGWRLHQALIDAKARRVITSIHQNGGVDLLLHGVAHG